MKRGKLYREDLVWALSVKRVSLWATVARHLWGVQVSGLAAKWTGYTFRDQQQVQGVVWGKGGQGECCRKKAKRP